MVTFAFGPASLRSGSWAMGFSMASRTASRMSGTGAIGALASITRVRSGRRTARLRSPYAIRSTRVSDMVQPSRAQYIPNR